MPVFWGSRMAPGLGWVSQMDTSTSRVRVALWGLEVGDIAKSLHRRETRGAATALGCGGEVGEGSREASSHVTSRLTLWVGGCCQFGGCLILEAGWAPLESPALNVLLLPQSVFASELGVSCKGELQKGPVGTLHPREGRWTPHKSCPGPSQAAIPCTLPSCPSQLQECLLSKGHWRGQGNRSNLV